MVVRTGDAFRGNYFFFHHTAADTMTTLDRTDMDYNTAIYAAIACKPCTPDPPCDTNRR